MISYYNNLFQYRSCMFYMSIKLLNYIMFIIGMAVPCNKISYTTCIEFLFSIVIVISSIQ